MSEETTTQQERGRRRGVLALLCFGGLLTFLAIFSIWVNRQALNTDNWVNTSEQLVRSEPIREQLADYMSNQLFSAVDVQAELEGALPPKLAPLAGPAAGGLHQLAPKIAEKVLEAPRFQALWANANRAAHEAFLRVVDGGGNAVSTEGGEVTLKLGSLLKEVGSQAGIGGNLAEKLPPDAGELTILKSNQLQAGQDAIGIVRHLPVVLTLLAIILYALALYLAAPRRREALRGIGIAFVVAGLLALAIRAIGGGYVVGALSGSASIEPAVQSAWSIATSLLVTVAVSTLCFGLLLIAGAWLAGPTKWAVSLRRLAAPRLRTDPGVYYAGVFVVFLVLLLWAPIAALGKPLGILIFAILLGLGAYVLRRQTLEEFPS